MRANHIESHFLIMIASFLLITIQVENRKAQFRSSAVDIGELSPASEMEPFFPNVMMVKTETIYRHAMSQNEQLLH